MKKIKSKETEVLTTYLDDSDKQPTLEDLQDMVDGYIEVLASRDGEKQIIVDEEGLLKGKQPNIEASDEAKRVIFGDAVILSGSARID